MRADFWKMTVLTIATVLLIAAAGHSMAAEPQEKQTRLRAEQARRSEKFEPTEEAIERIMRRLRQEDPELADDLEELRQDDPEQFRVELRWIMRERFGERVREHMARRETEKGARLPGAPQPPFRRAPGPPDREEKPPLMSERHAEYLRWLEENYPEEAEKLRRLQEQRPELYQRQRALGLSKYRRIFEAAKENPDLARVLKQDLELRQERARLLRTIRTTADEQEKKALVQKLEEVVAGRFDLILQKKQIEYEQLLERLEALKKEVEKNKARLEQWKDAGFKQEKVKEHLKTLLAAPEKFEWD